MSASSDPSRPAAVLQVSLFLLAISAPLLCGALGVGTGDASEMEKRRLAERPGLFPSAAETEASASRLEAHVASLGAFPAAFERYYDDHFGLRDPLIHFHNSLLVGTLGVSPTSQAMVGRGGWLFFAGQRAIDHYQAVDPFERRELEAWSRRLEEVDEWLDDRGIAFLVFFAPAKPTIYPEYLPWHVRRIGAATRLDQLVRHLREETSVRVLDPRPEFLTAKARGRLFHRTDSHWNLAGARLGCEVLTRELARSFPAVPVLLESDFELGAFERPGGDLALMMGMGGELTEEEISLKPRFEMRYRWITEGLTPATVPVTVREPGRGERRKPGATEQEAEDLPDVVLFRDSFGNALIPYLAHSVRRGVYYWQYLVDPEVIDFERPDFVVHEIGERNLMQRWFEDPFPEIEGDFELRRLFRAARPGLYELDGPGAGELVVPLEHAGADAGHVWRAPDGTVALDLAPGLPPDGGARDVVLRLDLETDGRSALRIRVGDEPQPVLAKDLALRREIVYLRLPDLSPGQRIRIELDGRAGTIELLGLSLREVRGQAVPPR
jgi:hypothetical protein